MTAGTKRCSKCKEQKPLDAFSPHKSRPGGLQSWCRACNAAWRRGSVRSRTRDSLQNKAYKAAERLLRQAHPEEFATLYDQERLAIGLPSVRGRS